MYLAAIIILAAIEGIKTERGLNERSFGGGKFIIQYLIELTDRSNIKHSQQVTDRTLYMLSGSGYEASDRHAKCCSERSGVLVFTSCFKKYLASANSMVYFLR